MKKTVIALIAFGMLAFPAVSSLAMNHAVKIQTKDGVGKYLTDAAGMTLYWFKKDSPGKSACVADCVDRWPLYYRDQVAAPKEMNPADFGTITRKDGKKQTTFKGYPLYYWMNDKQAGDTTGQGFKDVWYVIDPDNFPPK